MLLRPADLRILWYLASATAAGCSGAPAEHQPQPQLRGPLAALAVVVPRSLAVCDSVDHHLIVPFWRGPYRECRDSAQGRSQVLEVDADSVVTALHVSWTVSARERVAAFAAAEAELARRFGTGYRCGPTRAVWHAADSVRVALLMQVNTDVIGPNTLDSVPWTISRYARRGPLLDALWCASGPGVPSP